jgi:hypothetical protein
MFSRSPLSVLCCFFLACSFLPSVAAAQFFFEDTTFLAVRDTATFDVDLNTVPNKIILLTGTNTNLALKKGISVKYANPSLISTHPTASNPALMIDGRLAGDSFFELLPRQEGTQIRIDMQAIRIVNRVRMRTFPSGNLTFRPRGYSIYLSLDTLSFRKVKQIADNDLATTDDFFDPDTARYVMITIDKQDPALTNPVSTTFGEIEVYGTGYLSNGSFVSVPRDAGRTVNWSTASWSGFTPGATFITLQVRTGNTPVPDTTWSEWSEEIKIPGSLFTVFEPRRYMQYRANLSTLSTETPRLDRVAINFDTALVMNSAVAQIVPQVSPILQQAEIQYQITTQTSARSLGVDTVVIFTDLPITVTGTTVDNVSVNYQTRFLQGRVIVGLASTVNSNSVISIGLKFTPFLIENKFPSMVISKQNPSNPQRVDFNRSRGVESWTLSTTGVPEQIVVSAVADPNPFTPNGDGINDKTEFSFFVSNLLVPRPVRLTIYDVTGRKVRNLLDEARSAYAYVEANSIPWDGRDNEGKLLPPGLYIYQITVDVDGNTPAVVTKTVTIAY